METSSVKVSEEVPRMETSRFLSKANGVVGHSGKGGHYDSTGVSSSITPAAGGDAMSSSFAEGDDVEHGSLHHQRRLHDQESDPAAGDNDDDDGDDGDDRKVKFSLHDERNSNNWRLASGSSSFSSEAGSPAATKTGVDAVSSSSRSAQSRWMTLGKRKSSIFIMRGDSFVGDGPQQCGGDGRTMSQQNLAELERLYDEDDKSTSCKACGGGGSCRGGSLCLARKSAGGQGTSRTTKGSRNSLGLKLRCERNQHHHKAAPEHGTMHRIMNGMDFSLKECIAAIVLYLLFSVVSYSFVFESWPIIDSLYFAVVTFTTIGYGDLTPSTAAGKCFTCFFALSGVSCLGVALGVLGSNLVESELANVNLSQKSSRKKVMQLFDADDADDKSDEETEETDATLASKDSDNSGRHLANGPVVQKEKEEHTIIGSSDWKSSLKSWCQSILYAPWFNVVLLTVLFLLAGAAVIAYQEGWPWNTAVYFGLVTMCTIGYGDFTPSHSMSRLYAVLYIPAAVAIMGQLLATAAQYIIQKRREKILKELRCKEPTLRDLDEIDLNRDGVVSKLEFFEFMLVSMKHVDKEVLDSLHKQFDRIDVTGDGQFTREDLKAVARRRLSTAKEKLALSNYKKELLLKARRGSQEALMQ